MAFFRSSPVSGSSKKQLERSDRQLEHALALYEAHSAIMNPHDRDLAQSLLTCSGDLRYGLGDKHIRSKQAKLYSSRVDETLRTIQGAVESVIDIRDYKEHFV